MAFKKGDTASKGSAFVAGNSSLMVDLSSVEEQSFDNLPAGHYNVVIEKVAFAMSKSSDQPMWNITLVVVDGEFQNRKLWDMISFSPKALPISKGTIAKFAPELIAGPFNPEEVANKDVLVGKQFTVQVIISKYEGEERNKVKKILGTGKSGKKDPFLKG